MGFLQDLVTVLSGDASELVQCTNFVQTLQNKGVLEGLSDLEKNSLIFDALKSCGAANTPNTLLGEIYPIVGNRFAKMEANALQPTAHETCPEICTSDRSECGECLKQRLVIIDALNYAETPELYRQSASAQPPASSKCSLCSAPISPSMSVCDYCGTPVAGNGAGAFGASSGFVPSSTMPPEQQAYELIYKYQQKAVNEMFTPEAKKITINYQTSVYWTVYQTMSKAEMFGLAEKTFNETAPLLKVKMSLAELYYMADYYHMSVTAYLRGLFAGDPNLKTAAVLRKEEQYEREKEVNRRNHEIQMQAMEQKAQRQQEYWKRQAELYRPPQYGGGSGGGGYSRCCGRCIHYMSESNRCTESHHWPSSASDSCGLFKPR